MGVPEPLRSQMAAALRPTTTDVAKARELALRNLAGGAALNTTKLAEQLCRDAGVEYHRPHREHVEITGTGEQASTDLAASRIVRERLILAVVEAVAELEAQGLIAPAIGTDQPDVSIPYRHQNFSGGERFAVVRPMISQTYRLLRPYIGRDEYQFLDAGLFARSAGNLLGPRGHRCITEAVAAHRHGLHLTAASMLGAASEAGWYRLGEAVRGRSTDLANALDRGSTVQVISLVASELKSLVRRKASEVKECQVHASYLRDLRNYGLHPHEAHDEDREPAFTESGSALLMMESRRYFARLQGVGEAAGLLDSLPS